MTGPTQEIALRLTFPWPPHELSPNARAHWAARARAAKQYRRTCHFAALSDAGRRRPNFGDGLICVKLIFHPPDKRARDDDNMESAFKAGRDGMASALRFDDKQIRVTAKEIGHPIPGGAVIVDFIGCDDA